MYKHLIRIVFLLPFFFCSSCFELFPVEKRLVSKVNFDDAISYNAYLIETGATTNDAIQIWQITKTKEMLISTYEDYDSAYLSSYGKRNLVVALFKGNLGISKIDTINVGGKGSD